MKKAREHTGSYGYTEGRKGLNIASDGDAFRFLNQFAERTLVATQDGDHPEVYILNREGLWSNDISLFGGLYFISIDRFVKEFETARDREEINGFTDAEAKRMPRELNERKSTRNAEECRKAIGILMSQVVDFAGTAEDIPRLKLVTLCDVKDMDADVSCIAAPNGVVDLQSSEILDARVAKTKKLTTKYMLPDDFEAGAEHPDLKRLTAHLDLDDETYIWAEIGYSLHGRPSRRFLMVISPTNAGKSTLADAITVSLGPLVSRPPAQSLTQASQTRNEADPNAAAFVAPRRLAIMEEVESVRVSADVLKERTGDGAAISYRMLHQNPQERRATATPMLLGNSAPQRLGITDPAVGNRCKPLPFKPVPEDQLDPSIRQAWAPYDKDAKGAQDAKLRRQALVAMLVTKAVQYPPGHPPPMPNEAQTLINEWQDDELGEVGRWLVDGLVKAEGHQVVIGGLWEEVEKKFGADKEGRVHGWHRAGFARRLKRIKPELPSASRDRHHGRQRYWEGWKFLFSADDDVMDPKLDSMWSRS